MSDISKKTHFRRLRELLIAMCRYEDVFSDGEEYDFHNIHCYKILGSDLKGRNVQFACGDGNSFIVKNNNYNVYEVPLKQNRHNSPYGKFIFLMRNLDFHYWLMGELKVSLTERGEKVRWFLYGKYDVAMTDTKTSFCKTESRRQVYDLALGSAFSESNFDPLNIRRRVYSQSSTTLENIEKRKGHSINRERITNVSHNVTKYNKTKTTKSSRHRRR